MSKKIPHISRVLASALAAREWTAYRLSQESGVSQAQIGRLLHGQRTVNVAFRTLAALAEALGVGVEKFSEKSTQTP